MKEFTTAVEDTDKAAHLATRPGHFESKLNPYRQAPFWKSELISWLSMFEGLARGHGALANQMSAEEVSSTLAAGYDKLTGIEKQIVGHMLTRERYGADSSFPSNPYWFTDERIAAPRQPAGRAAAGLEAAPRRPAPALRDPVAMR